MLSMPITGSPGRDAVYAEMPAEQRHGGQANAAVKDDYQRQAQAAAATAQAGVHRRPGGAT